MGDAGASAPARGPKPSDSLPGPPSPHGAARAASPEGSDRRGEGAGEATGVPAAVATVAGDAGGGSRSPARRRETSAGAGGGRATSEAPAGSRSGAYAGPASARNAP